MMALFRFQPKGSDRRILIRRLRSGAVIEGTSVSAVGVGRLSPRRGLRGRRARRRARRRGHSGLGERAGASGAGTAASAGAKAMAKGGKDENGKSITAKNMGESSAVAGLVCGPGRQGNGARDG